MSDIFSGELISKEEVANILKNHKCPKGFPEGLTSASASRRNRQPILQELVAVKNPVAVLFIPSEYIAAIATQMQAQVSIPQFRRPAIELIGEVTDINVAALTTNETEYFFCHIAVIEISDPNSVVSSLQLGSIPIAARIIQTEDRSLLEIICDRPLPKPLYSFPQTL